MSPRRCQRIKRVCDVGFSIVVLVVALPLLAAVALVALVVQGRPVFYVSRRYVSPSRAIPIYKLRSMVPDAESARYDLKGRYLRGGFLDVPLDSDAYTPFGRLLERTQIVELPQVVNVLRDGLSWVGNRALPYDNIMLLTQFPGWEERFHSPCGLTGIAQVAGKHELSPEQRITLERLYSRVYREGNVLRCDWHIALATLRLLLVDRSLGYQGAARLLERCLTTGKAAAPPRHAAPQGEDP